MKIYFDCTNNIIDEDDICMRSSDIEENRVATEDSSRGSKPSIDESSPNFDKDSKHK